MTSRRVREKIEAVPDEVFDSVLLNYLGDRSRLIAEDCLWTRDRLLRRKAEAREGPYCLRVTRLLNDLCVSSPINGWYRSKPLKM